MFRYIIAGLVPPFAVCRFGCAGCCAAPIAVMWFAAIGAVIYGIQGGPAQLESVSWATIGLGLGLWIIAAIWAATVIRGVKEDRADPACREKRSTLCAIVTSQDDDRDPMSEIKKMTH